MHSQRVIPRQGFFELEKGALQKLIKGEPILKSCAALFSTPNQDADVVVDTGCKAMVAFFNRNSGETLSASRYSTLCKKVGAAKSFVAPERLPPRSSATKYHELRSYHQVMQWMNQGTIENPTDWGWEYNGHTLVPVIMDTAPAPEPLLKMIHFNCSSGCSTLRCTCKKHGLNCSRACGSCQDRQCENMREEPVSDDDDDDDDNFFQFFVVLYHIDWSTDGKHFYHRIDRNHQ